MDVQAVLDILNDCTQQFSHQADAITVQDMGPLRSVNIDFNSPVANAPPDMVLVDLQLLTVGVNKAKAEARRDALIELLNDWPETAFGSPTTPLKEGPSYISVGAVLGDQGAAFQLFALGAVLGLWKIITPANLGITGDEADRMAGSGFIMISGYNPEGKA